MNNWQRIHKTDFPGLREIESETLSLMILDARFRGSIKKCFTVKGIHNPEFSYCWLLSADWYQIGKIKLIFLLVMK